MQFLLKSHIGKWCKRGHVLGYIEAKDLTLTITAKVLLGMDLNGKERGAFLTAYNNFSANLFSLPINIPGSGLYRVSIRRVAVLIKVYQLNLSFLRVKILKYPNLLIYSTTDSMEICCDLIEIENFNPTLGIFQIFVNKTSQSIF